jgi:hypothetical protein
MRLRERIRRFWKPGAGDERPLTEQEREEDRSAIAYDERARTVEEFVSRDFDPDDPERG